jgi:hypothetical protein
MCCKCVDVIVIILIKSCDECFHTFRSNEIQSPCLIFPLEVLVVKLANVLSYIKAQYVWVTHLQVQLSEKCSFVTEATGYTQTLKMNYTTCNLRTQLCFLLYHQQTWYKMPLKFMQALHIWWLRSRQGVKNLRRLHQLVQIAVLRPTCLRIIPDLTPR